jgi:glycosyltransferase involved in cell wall biosynthesis
MSPPASASGGPSSIDASIETGAETPAPGGDAAEWLAVARLAREETRWLDAANAYRRVLDIDPAQAPIWVQYGHMLKEGGRREEAGAAYQTALELDPHNADTHLQFGHLYKITDRKHRAIQMYSRALELDPTLRDPAVELERLGAKSRVESILRRAAASHSGQSQLYFDVTDLLLFFRGSRTPTGIQRINLAIIEAGLQGAHKRDLEICALDIATGAWKRVTADQFLLLALLSREGARSLDPAWKLAVEDVFSSIAISAPLIFADHTVLVSLGSPWGIANYFMAVREAKRRSNLHFVAFVHDTIPLLLPEFCDGPTAMVYSRWVAGLPLHADLILANAENTRRDLIHALRRFANHVPPCQVIRPNGDFSLLFQNSGAVSDEVQALLDTKYVLFVGTIEPRKNHLFVLTAWRKLISELGGHSVPTLVLAGKLGWHCEAVVEFLQRTDNLDGKVRVFHEVSDIDLQALYRHAQFTVYNSHYEGWGLPVTESLSFRKVPVIPMNSALMESGDRHAIFYESNSEPSFLEAVRNLIANPDTLLDKEAELQASSAVRPWEEIFVELRDAAYQLKTPGLTHFRDHLACGKVYSLGAERSLRRPGDFAAAEAVRVGSGWHEIEEWGSWASRPVFELALNVDCGQTPEAGDANLLLYLHCRSMGPSRIRLEIEGQSPQTFLLPAGDTVLRAELETELVETGQVRVIGTQTAFFDLRDATDGKDGRRVGIGLRAFMLCYENDIAARVRLLEEISMGYILPLAEVPVVGAVGRAESLEASSVQAQKHRLA